MRVRLPLGSLTFEQGVSDSSNDAPPHALVFRGRELVGGQYWMNDPCPCSGSRRGTIFLLGLCAPSARLLVCLGRYGVLRWAEFSSLVITVPLLRFLADPGQSDDAAQDREDVAIIRDVLLVRNPVLVERDLPHDVV